MVAVTVNPLQAPPVRNLPLPVPVVAQQRVQLAALAVQQRAVPEQVRQRQALPPQSS